MENQKIIKFFNNYLKINKEEFKNKKIAIGFSGGLDSCALLDLMATYMPKNSFSVVYITHKDSPLTPIEENKNWLDFCTKRASYYGLDLINAIEEVPKTKAGWEGSGHTVRKNYAMNNYDIFFVAHHLDDLCENYFIQTLRGSGSAKVLKDEKNIKRPLLSFTKKELRKYLEDKNLNWVEDKTNKDIKIARNFWRHEILPKLENFYPDYRKRIITSSQKEEVKNDLLKDLAVIDGLNNLIEKNELNFNSNLSDNRQENLLYYYFKSKKINAETNQIKEILKLFKKQNKVHNFIFKDLTFNIENNFNKKSVFVKITPLIKPKYKF